MMLDVLDWVTSGTNWSVVGFVARGVFVGQGGYGYGAGLILNHSGVNGRVTPWLSYGAYSTNGMAFDLAQFPLPYHLEYSGVGTNFSLRVVQANTKKLIRQMNWTDASRSQGIMGLWVNAPSGVQESHSITVDNFFLSGTKR
jgi:hypothetical protein